MILFNFISFFHRIYVCFSAYITTTIRANSHFDLETNR